MTDRELLEKAAKAAGIEVRYQPGSHRFLIEAPLAIMDGTYFAYWDPLTDDRDALRLAVKLRMEVYHGEDEGAAVYASYTNPNRAAIAYMIEYYDDINNMGDPYAATRRAIVRAAAQIGENNGN